MEAKERLKIPRQAMPEQEPEARRHNFQEVPYGYTAELAQTEAMRCLQCKKPKCVEGCPVNVDIPGFIKLIVEGDYIAAARKIKETNSLPAICGRVCPQETQCEEKCTLGNKYQPVAIGRLERFAADYERTHRDSGPPLGRPAPPNGRRVAIIGSGPAGLTAAGDLVKMGYDVTIFEALHEAGGVLTYGIPEFRLPKSIVQAEINDLKAQGVKIETNVVIGKTLTVDELLEQEGFNAIFIGTGAGLPVFMHIPGENLCGVYSANEFLTRINLMRGYQFPDSDTPVYVGKRVVVVGGGNVAMDAARTSLRLQPEKVTVVYRRSRTEMPARAEEIEHAEQEGVEFLFLTNPVRILGNDEGWVTGVECVRMELGEPDASGRRSPIPVAGSEFILPAETFIIAIGNNPHPLVTQTTPNLETTRRGNIVASLETGQTSRPGVFAGGDIVTGAATVIEAMGAGKRAAAAIHRYLTEQDGQEKGKKP